MATINLARKERLVALRDVATSRNLQVPAHLAGATGSEVDAFTDAKLDEAELTLVSLILPENSHLRVALINRAATGSLKVLTIVILLGIILAVASALFCFMHSESRDATEDIKFYIGLSAFGASLGILGACCQILQRYKLIANPKKAGPLTELNLIWAWLLWGVVAGWIVTFMFSTVTFRGFLQLNAGGDLDGSAIATMLSPLLPIAAGYSSTLLGGLLDRVRTPNG